MNAKDIDQAKDPDLRAPLIAIRRAAAYARQEAIRTNTHIVIYSNGALQRVSAAELREQVEHEAKA